MWAGVYACVLCICICVCGWVLTTVRARPSSTLGWFELSEALASWWQASHLTLQYQNVSQPKQSTAIGQQPTNSMPTCISSVSCLVPSNESSTMQPESHRSPLTFAGRGEAACILCILCFLSAFATLDHCHLRYWRSSQDSCDGNGPARPAGFGGGWWGCSTGGWWDGRQARWGASTCTLELRSGVDDSGGHDCL